MRWRIGPVALVVTASAGIGMRGLPEGKIWEGAS
jgi:hypothetical protein